MDALPMDVSKMLVGQLPPLIAHAVTVEAISAADAENPLFQSLSGGKCIHAVELPSGRQTTTWQQITQARMVVIEDQELMRASRDEHGISIH